jgi:predicted metal-binding membrane protein
LVTGHGTMTVTNTTVLEAVLRRDRMVLLVALVAVTAIAWIWILLGAGTGMNAVAMTVGARMSGMAGMMMAPVAWTAGYAGLMFAMWWVMMVAMMLPTAAPILLLFARVNRAERAGDRPYVPTGIFAAGYLAAWGGFSALATLLQWALEQLGLLSPMMTMTNYWLGGAILTAAGIWQFTPIKGICLRHCRSPLSFLAKGWRPGRLGAFRMGIEHGIFCLGCCWFLMGLLFFGGVMNLFWIAGLAVFVLLEKAIPLGPWIGRLAGIGVAAWGVLMFAAAVQTGTATAATDYRFEAVEVQAAAPGKTTLAVRLVHVPDKKPVEGAVILEAKTNMGPSGMAEMSGKVTPLPSGASGLYRFFIETGMAGKWELIFGAQVQGEAGAVRGAIIYDVAN